MIHIIFLSLPIVNLLILLKFILLQLIIYIFEKLKKCFIDMQYIYFITLIFFFILSQIYLLKDIFNFLLLFLPKYNGSISQVFKYFSLFLELIFHLEVYNQEASQSVLHEKVAGNHEKCSNKSCRLHEHSHVVFFDFQSVKHKTLEKKHVQGGCKYIERVKENQKKCRNENKSKAHSTRSQRLYTFNQI